MAKKVVGLAYSPEKKGLPAVVLKATGEAAKHVELEFKKQKNDLRIVEDEELVNKLYSLPTDSEISPDLYELVAILLVHIYTVEAKMKDDSNHD